MGDYLIITGLSGAGRSTAADTLDDHGWLVIDNLPPELIPKVSELVSGPGDENEKVALVSAEGITRERAVLEAIKEQADVVVDTSELNVHQLRDRVVELFERPDPTAGMQTSVVSFGYKHGVPLDSDVVLDCRFLPNPHWVDELRPHTGLDEPVREYVMTQPETKEFLAKLDELLDLVLPGFVKEGKAYLTIAVGCTGGRHRSVVLAEEVARSLRDHGFSPAVHHRDLSR
jgi:UPF0042 nucleotide-binding protein